MIPLTVSFFTKGAKNRKQGLTNAILYGLFIFVIYLLLSIPFHLLDSLDPEILNNISTNVTLNVIFFIIFIVFALSFFGYFELTLPQYHYCGSVVLWQLLWIITPMAANVSLRFSLSLIFRIKLFFPSQNRFLSL